MYIYFCYSTSYAKNSIIFPVKFNSYFTRKHYSSLPLYTFELPIKFQT